MRQAFRVSFWDRCAFAQTTILPHSARRGARPPGVHGVRPILRRASRLVPVVVAGFSLFACLPNYDILIDRSAGGAGGASTTSTTGGAGGSSTTRCTDDTQCQGLVCVSGTCVDSCADNVKDFSETDVDCGGPKCGPCPNGDDCLQNSDCKSAVCNSAHVCIEPSCTDGIKDQNETAVDCGGVCAPPDSATACPSADAGACTFSASRCATGVACVVPSDCLSFLCDSSSNTCKAPIVVPTLDMITDLESGAVTILSIQGRQGSWYAFSDANEATASPEAVPAGPAESGYGLHLVSSALPTGGYGGAGFDLDNPSNGSATKQEYDASQYTGVEFWVRGSKTGAIRLNVVDNDTWEGPGGGQPAPVCTTAAGGCDDHFGQGGLAVSDQWAFYQSPFAGMTQSGWGEKFPALNTKQLISIQFELNSGLAYDTVIEDVAFY